MLEDRSIEWVCRRLPDLKKLRYERGAFSDRVTLLTNWLWMDERFDVRLDGLLGAILMSWHHCGWMPVSLIVNRITAKLDSLSREWGIRLIHKPELKGGGGDSCDLNRNVLLHMADWFDTEYVLTFQDHAFPLRSGLDEFIGKWDYVGAPWPFNADDWITRMLLPHRGHVGNGAFTVRSKKLCERVSYYYGKYFSCFPHCYLFNDDYFIGKTLPSWMRNYTREVSIAPPEVAAGFSLENNRELQDAYNALPFGFHGPDAFSYLTEKGWLDIDGDIFE